MKISKEEYEKEFGSIHEKFNYKNNFLEVEKIIKFDNMIDEYNQLINYRYSLQIILSSKHINYDYNNDFNNKEKSSHKKRMSVEQIISFENEINSLNIIISWIENFLGIESLVSKYKKTSNKNQNKK